MNGMLIYPLGKTPACRFCGSVLEASGISLVDHPTPEITHLLLDVPAFADDGSLRSGGSLTDLLRMLPPEITVVGGNLKHPALESYGVLDFLQDEGYLAANAAITAECALQVAAQQMQCVFAGLPVLVIGWGRIGKCLGQLLSSIGARVTFAARKKSDLAMLRALGYRAVAMDHIREALGKQRLVFNTAPARILSETETSGPSCLYVDLASVPGMEGPRVIHARGLPGMHKPESTGVLMAQTFLRLSREETI